MTAGKNLPPLRFRPDGTFTVMQISDVQDTGKVGARSLALLEAALDQEKPDFVIFTGDQIMGYGASLWFGSRAQKERRCTQTIQAVLAPLEARGIPFTFTFGNHDHDAPMSCAEQVRVYQSAKLCYAEDTPEVPGYANHAVQVLHAGSDKMALNFYMLDSHKSLGLGYMPLDPAQVAWYRRTRDTLTEKNGGNPVPSLLFQHIPVEEMMQLYRKVPRGTPGSFEGYRNYKGNFYALDSTKVAPGSYAGELPSSPDKNAGLFEAAKEKGDMIGMFFGHDHNNGFHGKVDGITLGYAPGLGFAAYGPGRRRGVRVFRFREDRVADYQTYVATDEVLMGPHAKTSWWCLQVRDRTPSSFGAAKPLIRRSVIGVTAATLGGAALLAAAKGSQQKRRK